MVRWKKKIFQFPNVYVNPLKMAASQSLVAGKFQQAAILTGDVEEPFSKLHYFSSKYTFRMMSKDRGYY